MRTVMMIYASPLKEAAISTQIANDFLKKYKKKNPLDEVGKLYANEIEGILLTQTLLQKKANEQDIKVVEKRKQYADMFMKSDIIIIASPMWNFGIPGFLKELLDCFVVANKSFKYINKEDNNVFIPIGLCGDKKLVFIQSMGGDHVGEEDIAYLQIQKLFGFMGVEDIRYVRATNNDIPGASTKEMARIKAQKIAETI
ncbi:MAG: NAD(P)H-dependent oxidoreductase [Breznakia sp.]